MAQKSNQLIWIVVSRDAAGRRLQFEATITDLDLEVAEEGPKLLVDVQEVDTPVSSLIAAFPERSLQAGEAITPREAEEAILEYVRCHTTALGSFLAGEMTRNVRDLLNEAMKELASHFYYKSFDVCSFREIFSRWKSEDIPKFENPIDEMRFLRDELIRKPGIGEPSDIPIIWIDCEMTGLTVGFHRIVEISCVVTDANLEIIAISDNLVIKQNIEVMRYMTDWCRKTFKKNGLTQEIISSSLTVEDAENQMLEFLSNHCPKGVCPIAGNSIAVDREFIEADMPKLGEFLGPSDVDVTAVCELFRYKRPHVKLNAKIPNSSKKSSHRAEQDILRSIAVMKLVRQYVEKGVEEQNC